MILDDLDRHARERPGERAVVEISADGTVRELTWAALKTDADRVAAALLLLGVREGEPVAFQLPNRLEFVTIALGALRAGAVCEPLMPIFRERELSFMLGESRARVLFVPTEHRGHDHGAMAEGLRAILPGLEHVVVLPAGYDELPDGPRAFPTVGSEHLAQLLFTSGTSGEPKGALHRHDVLDRAADHHIAHFGLGPEDVIYVPSPLAHQTGFLYGMWIALRLGVPQVLQEVWDAEIGLDAMRRFGVTFVQAATPFLADLTRVADERDERPERLRMFVATGAAIPRELARKAREVLGAEVGGAWGTTESCLGCAFAPGDPPERAWGTDGRALDGVTLRIVDDAGRSLAPGEEGNFEVHTDCLFEGYLNRPELTAEAVTPDGWYRTGDLARIDDERLRADHRPGQGRDQPGRREGARWPRSSSSCTPTRPSARWRSWPCPTSAWASAPARSWLASWTSTRCIDYLDAGRVAKPYWPERLELVETLPRTPSGRSRSSSCARRPASS